MFNFINLNQFKLNDLWKQALFRDVIVFKICPFVSVKHHIVLDTEIKNYKNQ